MSSQKKNQCKALLAVVAVGLFFVSCSEESSTENSLTAEESELLARVNALRTAGCSCGTDSMPPVDSLKWNKVLASVAYNHSKDMVDRS